MTNRSDQTLQQAAELHEEKFRDPTPFRKAAVDSGAPVRHETPDGGAVIYFPNGGVLALRRMAA